MSKDTKMPSSQEEEQSKKLKADRDKKKTQAKNRAIKEFLEEDEDVAGLLTDRDLAKIYGSE